MHKSLSRAFLQHSICFRHYFWNEARREILERWIKCPHAATPKDVLWDIYKLALQVCHLWSEVQPGSHVGVINAVMKYDLTSNLRWLRRRLIFRQEINELQSWWYIQWVEPWNGPFVTLRLNPLTDDPRRRGFMRNSKWHSGKLSKPWR